MNLLLGEHGGAPITHTEFQRLLHGLDVDAGATGGAGEELPHTVAQGR